MAKQIEQQHQPSRRAEDDTALAEGADLRSDELDKEVSCCLNDIAEALEENPAETEDERIAREFDEIADRYRDAEISWDQANEEMTRFAERYAHRKVTVGWCCGSPYYEFIEG